MASGIRGSLRLGMVGLLCSHHAQPRTKFLTVPPKPRTKFLTVPTRPAQIFVAVLGASNFTYAEASWTQALGDWIGAHTRAFEAIGGVPTLLLPDNTKVAVIKACLYEPQVNRTYAEMATHYDTAILPARPRRPRDKAK